TLTSRSPFITAFPSSTSKSMISPATSGEIFTSVSGWTFPVAETVCMIVLRIALSVVTGIGFSRLLQMIDTAIQSTIRPIDPKMICFLRRARRCFAVKGAGAGVLTVWCIGGGVLGMKASALVGCLTLANEIPFMTTLRCGQARLWIQLITASVQDAELCSKSRRLVARRDRIW